MPRGVHGIGPLNNTEIVSLATPKLGDDAPREYKMRDARQEEGPTKVHEEAQEQASVPKTITDGEVTEEDSMQLAKSWETAMRQYVLMRRTTEGRRTHDANGDGDGDDNGGHKVNTVDELHGSISKNNPVAHKATIYSANGINPGNARQSTKGDKVAAS